MGTLFLCFIFRASIVAYNTDYFGSIVRFTTLNTCKAVVIKRPSLIYCFIGVCLFIKNRINSVSNKAVLFNLRQG